MKLFFKILMGIGIFILLSFLGIYIYCNYGIQENDIREGKYLDKATEKTMEEFLPKIKEARRLQSYSKLITNPTVLYETTDKIYWGYVEHEILRSPVRELYFTTKDENWNLFLNDTIR